MGVAIREAIPSDAKTLAALGAATFTGAFGHLYSDTDRNAFLHEKHSEGFYTRTLADTAYKVWLAEENAMALAYAMAGPNSLPCDPPRPQALELTRIYVSKGQYSRGLGRLLMEQVIHHAKTGRFSNIVLSVFSGNEAGQRFYIRHGFTKIGEYGFKVGEQIDHEYIFCKPL